MTRKILTSIALPLLIGACAGAGTGGAPQPGPRAAPSAHPGFDTGIFPGEAALRAWRASSPYRWVGYYLASPCHRDASWMGTRATLERMGWGVAILYVGQQAFDDRPAVADTVPATRILCSRTLLTAEQGRTDARDAAARAAAEGFTPGSVVFLDVERMQSVAPAMEIYYQAWMDQLLADGRFRPGTYAHRANAAALFALAETAYLRQGRRETPPFWVAGGEGFSLDREPGASGLPFAEVWQGVLDAQRSFGGISLRVDENVATRPSPSAPR